MLAAAVGGLQEMFAAAPERLFPPENVEALRRRLAERAPASRAPRVAYDLSRFQPEAAASRIEAFYRRVIAASRADGGRSRQGS